MKKTYKFNLPKGVDVKIVKFHVENDEFVINVELVKSKKINHGRVESGNNGLDGKE